MLKNDEPGHYDGENTQWICLAAFGLALSTTGLAIFFVLRPELASKSMIILFITQIVAAGIVRLTFFARKKHQSRIAILLVTIALLVMAMFIVFFSQIYILPLYKDFINI